MAKTRSSEELVLGCFYHVYNTLEPFFQITRSSGKIVSRMSYTLYSENTLEPILQMTEFYACGYGA